MKEYDILRRAPRFATTPSQPVQPQGFFSALGPALMNYSPVVSAVQKMGEPIFPIDPNFNLGQAMTDAGVPQSQAFTYLSARSADHFAQIKANADKRAKQDQVIGAAGFRGFLAAGVASLVSPTTFIPLMGPAKGIKGLAQMAALAGAASALDEAVLYNTADGYTEDDLLFGVSVGTVAGMLLGSAAKFMEPGERQLYEQALTEEQQTGRVLVENDDPGTETATVEFEPPVNAPRAYEEEVTVPHGGERLDPVPEDDPAFAGFEDDRPPAVRPDLFRSDTQPGALDERFGVSEVRTMGDLSEAPPASAMQVDPGVVIRQATTADGRGQILRDRPLANPSTTFGGPAQRDAMIVFDRMEENPQLTQADVPVSKEIFDAAKSFFRMPDKTGITGDVRISANTPAWAGRAAQRFREALGDDLAVTIYHVDDIAGSGDGSALLKGVRDGSVNGYIRFDSTSQQYVIVLGREAMRNRVSSLETLFHELGHMAHYNFMAKASPDTRRALFADYARWRGEIGARGDLERLPESTTRLALRRYPSLADEAAGAPSKVTAYDNSFEEWFAEMTSRYMTSNAVGDSVVAEFFANVVKFWRRAMAFLRAEGYAPRSIDQFFAEMRANNSKRGLERADGPMEGATEAASYRVSEGVVSQSNKTPSETGPRQRLTQGYKRPKNYVAGKAFDAMGKLSPIVRMTEQKFFPSLSYWATRIQTPGLVLAGLENAQPNAGAGTLYARTKTHEAAHANFVMDLDDAFARHIYGPLPEGVRQTAKFRQIKAALIGPPPGKMTFKDYSEAVYNALSTGEMNDPSLGRGVAAFKKFFDYFDNLHDDYLAILKEEAGDAADDIEPLYVKDPDDLGPGVENYAHQIMDHETLLRKADKFVRKFGEYGAKEYQKAFGSAHERYTNSRRKRVAYRNLLQLNDAQLDEQYNLLSDDIADIDADPDYAGGRVALRELEKQLQDAGESKEAIKAALKKEREALGPDFAAADRKRKQLLSNRNVVRKLGGAAADRRDALEEKITSSMVTQIGTYHSVAGRINDALKKINRTDNLADKKLTDALNSYARAMKQLAAQNEKIRSQAYGVEHPRGGAVKLGVEGRGGRLLASLDKFDLLNARFEKAIEVKDAAEAGRLTADQKIELLQDMANDFTERARVANGRRYMREQDALEKVEALAPEKIAEYRAAELEKTEARIADLDNSFRNRWIEEGARDLDIESGRADFSEQGRLDAMELHRLLVGNPEKVAGMVILGAKRGAQLRRVLKMPYEDKKEWLITDAERVAASFERHMAPDLEMWRMTGDVNGARIFDELKADYDTALGKFADATHVRLPRGTDGTVQGLKAALNDVMTNNKPFSERVMLLARGEFVKVAPGEKVADGLVPLTDASREVWSQVLVRAYRDANADLAAVIERHRHTRGASADVDSIGHRLGQAALNANVFRYMGRVAISSIPDLARPIFKFGMRKTLGNGWHRMLMDKNYRRAITTMDHEMGIALDPILHNRAQAIMDLPQRTGGYKTLVERGLQAAANKTGLVAGFDMWTAGVKHVAASVVHASMSSYIPRVALMRGTAEELAEARKFLRRVSLDDNMIKRIHSQYMLPGGSTEFQGGVRLPNTGKWTDSEAARAYAAAVLQEVNDLIITPGYDLPVMVDANMAYRLFFQFKSFTFAATTRILMSGLQDPDIYLLEGASMSLALGALSYYVWAVSIGGKSYEDAMKLDEGKWLAEAYNRSGLAGITSFGTDIGAEIPLLSQYALFDPGSSARRRSSSLMGAVFGPTYDLVEQVASVAQGLDSPTQSTLHSARLLGVYQNHWLFSRAFDRLEEATADTFNFPERREPQ